MPPELQAKLLRVLQERVVERVGSHQEIALDFRLVAATNRQLEQAVREGRFREDLYFRIGVFPLEIPPLRARPGDIAVLATHFLRRYAAPAGRPGARLTPEALERMRQHPWPGNVRELENMVQRALLMADSSVIGVDDLGLPNLGLPNLGGAHPVPAYPSMVASGHAVLGHAVLGHVALGQAVAGHPTAAHSAASPLAAYAAPTGNGAPQTMGEATGAWRSETHATGAAWPEQSPAPSAPSAPSAPTDAGATLGNDSMRVRAREREHILEVLRRVNGSRKQAIALLGISERALRYKLKQYREEGFLT
jgi:two-component system response regulator FlrC